MKEELLKGLSEEQVSKVKACKNNEEILALAKKEGIELSSEQLEAVSGGACTPHYDSEWECPYCHGHNTIKVYEYHNVYYHCYNCDKDFKL